MSDQRLDPTLPTDQAPAIDASSVVSNSDYATYRHSAMAKSDPSDQAVSFGEKVLPSFMIVNEKTLGHDVDHALGTNNPEDLAPAFSTDVQSAQTGAADQPGTPYQPAYDSNIGAQPLSFAPDQNAAADKPAAAAAIESSSPQGLGKAVDHAISTNNPQELAQAEKAVSEAATEVFKNSHGSIADIKQFESDLNENIPTERKGVEFEVKGNTVITHIAEELDSKTAKSMQQEGDKDVVWDRMQLSYVKDLTPAISAEVNLSQNPQPEAPSQNQPQTPLEAPLNAKPQPDASDQTQPNKVPVDVHSLISPVLGNMVDRAISDHSPAELAQVQRLLAKQAAANFDGSPESLKQLEDSINNNVKTKGTGVEFEVQGNSIVTHISTQITEKQLLDAAQKADPTIRQDATYGAVRDLVPAVSTPLSSEVPNKSVIPERPQTVIPEKSDAPAKVPQSDKGQQAVQERHILTPNDGHLIENLAHKQSQNLSLSPESEQKLERALTLVATGDRTDLAKMMPELASPGSPLGLAFKNALQELGYAVKMTTDASGKYSVEIDQPKPGNGNNNQHSSQPGKSEHGPGHTQPHQVQHQDASGSVTVKQGDSLWKIAKEQLGDQASNAQILKYTQEIARANGMPDPFKPENQHNHQLTIHPGQEIKLPGKHDGSTTHTDNDQEHKSKPLSEHRTEANADKVHQRDSADVLLAENERLEQERERLKHNLDASDIDPSDKARIYENMRQFEQRATSDHLSGDEVAKTYDQANKLYESTSDSPIPHSDKQILADQIINHAAHPHNIDQGQHETCNVTTIESRLFSKSPSEAAKVIADAATTGSYTAKDGSSVLLNQLDLTKDSESADNPPRDGARSYASKLFQETALDLLLQQHGERYVEIPGNVPGNRSGYGLPDREAIADQYGGMRQFTGVNFTDLAGIEAKFTGNFDADHFLIQDESSSHTFDGNSDSFPSEEDFQTKLEDLKAHNELPAVIYVNGNRPPISSSPAVAAGGSGGGHVVTITDYDPTTGKVSYANQWGSQNNHMGRKAVPLDEFYQSTVRN